MRATSEVQYEQTDIKIVHSVIRAGIEDNTCISRGKLYGTNVEGTEFIIVWPVSSEISILARLDFGKGDNNSRRCLPQEHVLCALTPRRFHVPSCVKFDNLTPAGRLESIRRK